MKKILYAIILISSVLTTTEFASASVQVLPDSISTPGAINVAVSQSNIQSTICVSGYTKTIRPPASYTTKLKIRQLGSLPYSSYGSTNTSLFEEDHLIPLELGGNPTDSKNLWPEPRFGSTTAAMKDKLENALHVLVCNGSLKLSSAQKAIATNWYVAYTNYVLRKNG